MASSDPHGGDEAALEERINTLEYELEDLESGRTRNLAFGLGGGALGGLVLGAVLGRLLQRRREGAGDGS
jgi:hypothetical protein